MPSTTTRDAAASDDAASLQRDLDPAVLSLLDACGDPVFVVDENYRLVHWSPAAEEAFNIPAHEALGRACFEVMDAKATAGRRLCHPHCEKWAFARRGLRVRNFEMQVIPEGGMWLNVSILPIRATNGSVVALAHLARNINQVKRLEQVVRQMVRTAADALVDNPEVPMVEDPSVTHLTAREREVLRLLARGGDTATLAEALGVSPHTARNHVAAVLTKLGVHSRVEAAAFAFEHHLV